MPIYEFECEECGSHFEELLGRRRARSALSRAAARSGPGA